MLGLEETGIMQLLWFVFQGNVLPAPLSSIGELFPFITPYEGYLLLLSVWKYIKVCVHRNPDQRQIMDCRECKGLCR